MFSSFFALSCISVLIIGINSLITYEVLRVVWTMLPKMRIQLRLRVLLIVVPIFICHILSIWIYALTYFLIEYYTDYGMLSGNIARVEMSYASFIERLYFSATTYTSLGFGDIIPTRDLRMLASAEVLNGLVMIGWTVSFTYLTMEKFWAMPSRHNKQDS